MLRTTLSFGKKIFKWLFVIFSLVLAFKIGEIVGYIRAGIDFIKMMKDESKEIDEKIKARKTTYSNYFQSSRRFGSPEVYKVDNLTFDSRSIAQDILDTLLDMVEDYGSAKVADFYDAANVNAIHTDHKYGWTNLEGAYVKRVPNGYVIEFPKARLLK